MDNSIWLVVGLGSIAFVIGYLAGGSKSPVVSAMIAGIFGLVTVSTGMITGSDLVKKLDEVRAGVVAHSKDNAAFQKTLDDIKNGLQKPSASGSGASSPSDAKIDEVTKNIGA